MSVEQDTRARARLPQEAARERMAGRVVKNYFAHTGHAKYYFIRRLNSAAIPELAAEPEFIYHSALLA